MIPDVISRHRRINRCLQIRARQFDIDVSAEASNMARIFSAIFKFLAASISFQLNYIAIIFLYVVRIANFSENNLQSNCNVCASGSRLCSTSFDRRQICRTYHRTMKQKCKTRYNQSFNLRNAILCTRE